MDTLNKLMISTSCMMLCFNVFVLSQPTVEELDRRVSESMRIERETEEHESRSRSSVGLLELLIGLGKNAKTSESNSNLEELMKLYNAGRYAEALPYANRLIFLNSNEGSVYDYRGLLNIQLENYESALKDFNKAIDLGFEEAECYSGRGYARFKLNKSEEALNDFDIAIKKFSLDSYLYEQSGKIYYELASAYNERGLVLCDLERYEEAVDDFNQAMKINQKEAVEYCYNRGTSKLKLGLYFEAEKDFKAYMLKYPDDALSYNQLGIMNVEQRNFSNALIYFDLCAKRKMKRSSISTSEVWQTVNLVM